MDAYLLLRMLLFYEHTLYYVHYHTSCFTIIQKRINNSRVQLAISYSIGLYGYIYNVRICKKIPHHLADPVSV